MNHIIDSLSNPGVALLELTNRHTNLTNKGKTMQLLLVGKKIDLLKTKFEKSQCFLSFRMEILEATLNQGVKNKQEEFETSAVCPRKRSYIADVQGQESLIGRKYKQI